MDAPTGIDPTRVFAPPSDLLAAADPVRWSP
jgi:hypothetical protein